MSKGLDDGIERNPAEKNPWYWLMQESILLDNNSPEPAGWHWLVFLHYILEADLADIQKTLPEEHPLKLSRLPTDSDKQEFKRIIENFYMISGNPEIIQKIYFANLIFNEEVNFSNFIFPLPVDFTDTDFKKIAHFNKAFFYQATFIRTRFFDIASFLEIQTLIEINFNDAVFYNIAHFINSKFKGVANFSRVTFSSRVFFNSVIFEQMAYFINTRFEVHTPNFYNAKISADLIWECDVNYWPQTEKHEMDETDAYRRVRIKQNRNAYENLVSQMNKLDKYHDGHFFYRQETRCRQQFEKNYFTYCSYWLYEKFADYGYGVESAVAVWFWHMVLGAQAIAIMAFINAWWASWKGGAWETTKSVFCSIPISIANSHSFLFFNKGPLSGCYKYFTGNNFFNTVWLFQIILGVIFLFLLLLTLRTRFRLK